MSETPSHYGKKLQRIFTLDEEGEVMSALLFVRGFLDLLYGAALSDDGLENIDPDGFLTLTTEARDRIDCIKELLNKLNNPQGEEPI